MTRTDIIDLLEPLFLRQIGAKPETVYGYRCRDAEREYFEAIPQKVILRARALAGEVFDELERLNLNIEKRV